MISNNDNWRILVVDDDAVLRQNLQDIFEIDGYSVDCAADGIEALERMAEKSFDLVLSDISMPRMAGIELLEEVGRRWPEIHRVLITAHNLEDYITALRAGGLGSVLTKTVPFPVDDVLRVTRCLLTRDIFGVGRLFNDQVRILTWEIGSSDEISMVSKKLARLLPVRSGQAEMIFEELLTNAVYYGVFDADGATKENWMRSVRLENTGKVEASFAEDEEKVVVSICDTGGRLRRETVLFWLERQMCRDDNGLPIGIWDSHGRGLYISRAFSDRLMVNIERGARCEIVTVFYKRDPPAGEKPLLVIEI